MKTLIKLLSLVLLLSAGAFCQSLATGSITAAGTDCTTAGACVVANINQNTGGAMVQLSGTFTGTLRFESSIDNVTWVAINGTPLSSTTGASSATTANIWQFNVAGASYLRVRASAFSSGPILVTIQPSTASARSGGGGGGGGIQSINSDTSSAQSIVGAGTVSCATVAGTTTCTGTGGAPAFSAITTGTNAAALHMGTGGSLDATGSGTIAATTAAALASAPTKCSAGNYPLGIDASGNAQNCTAAGGSTTASTWFGPRVNLGVGQGAVTLGGTAGCSLVGSFPATGAPTVYGIAATTTYRQTCRPQFATTTVVYYADTLSNNYPSNSALTFRIKAFHPTDNNTAHADTFGIAITCTSATAEPVFSSVQNFAAVNVIGTAGGAPAGQNEEQVELTLTPGAGGIPACGASDTIQMSPTLVSTTASDNPVIVFFGGRF